MKRTIISGLAVFLTTLLMASWSAAGDTQLDLNISKKEIEGQIRVKVNPMKTPTTLGGGFLYSEDDLDFWLANLNIAVKDQVFAPGLNLGLGLKGVLGNTDFGTFDRSTMALGFQFLGDYDFRKAAKPFPVSIFATLTYAPEILSLRDTEKYFDFFTGAAFHINEFTSVYGGYRDVDIDYNDGGFDSSLSHDAFVLGVTFSF